MELTAVQLNYIINHVFLPPMLPHEYDGDDPKNDAALLYCVFEAAQKFCSALENSDTDEALSVLPAWTGILVMLENIASLHAQPHLVKEDVTMALRRMQVKGQSHEIPRSVI
jgi:hypothetical protein